MKKYLCVHGHFYQPPRENPWTGVIERQESAAPAHDWNERITKECYAPNTKTEVRNNKGEVLQTVNNYDQISFNFGPTLLSWMQGNAPETYQRILEADRMSLERFSGHGSAIAQAYNHMILPLANKRDLETQVVWGIRDFEYRFKRRPEGMWLPETAVSIAALEKLAEHGIVYTILAPTQIKEVAEIGSNDWEDVSDGGIDSQLSYLCRLPSGRVIHLFIYNGFIANEVAFGNMLADGANFAKRMIRQFPRPLLCPRLVHIANDGETFGHHHRFGNMALAYMLYHVETQHLARISIYGEFLEKHPPRYEVKILENTSWSCGHGIERWRDNCGCKLDYSKATQQKWRKYLREALDWLRDTLAVFYEQAMSVYFDDPWAVRNAYIDVILDPTEATLSSAVWSKARRKLSEAEKAKIMDLCEMQHHAMLMYTSCGWFFDDISGLESKQILQYAARAIQLARATGGGYLKKEFLRRLALAESNDPKIKNGCTVYTQFIKQALTSARKHTNV